MKKRTYKLIESINNSIIDAFPYLTEKEHSEIMENFIYDSLKKNLREEEETYPMRGPLKWLKDRYEQNKIDRNVRGIRRTTPPPKKKDRMSRGELAALARNDGNPELLYGKNYEDFGMATPENYKSADEFIKKRDASMFSKLVNSKNLSPNARTKLLKGFMFNDFDPKRFKIKMDQVKKDPKYEKDVLGMDGGKPTFSILGSNDWDKDFDSSGKAPANVIKKYRYKQLLKAKSPKLDDEALLDADTKATPFINSGSNDWDKDFDSSGKASNKAFKIGHMFNDFDPEGYDINSKDIRNKTLMKNAAIIAALTGGTIASGVALYKKYGPAVVKKIQKTTSPSMMEKAKSKFKSLMKKIRLAESRLYLR